MHVCEFKAWFEGFTEDMTKLPTVKQWSRIKARIEEIDGEWTTERIFIDRYRPYWTNVTVGTHQTGTAWAGTSITGTVTNCDFMNLGKAEAALIAA